MVRMPTAVEVDRGAEENIHPVSFEYFQCGSVHLVLQFSIEGGHKKCSITEIRSTVYNSRTKSLHALV
jgi:hypothetical protein